jgi:plastocyanin
MRTLILGLILVSMLSLGCIFQSETNVTNNTTAPPPPPPPPKTPTIAIASPGAGELMVVPGDTADVTISVTTQNLILKAPGGAKKVGEGYFKVTLDGQEPQTFSTKNILLSGLAMGEHTVKVELFHNDKTPYSPSISKEVRFTLEKEKPKEYVPQTHNVVINDFTYSPASITIKRTDSVTFENKGAFPRDATCFINNVQMFDTKVLSPGKSATIKFDEVLECDFYSSLHRAMTGHIKVEPNDYDVANQ